MTKRMLVDAAYPEETRVVVADNETLLDFDFETASKRQLKGNIYLAKVVRVEPSLQAAFVEYGGNRHGFLAFSEIHPDYYQIPQADRDQLSELESQLARAGGDDDEPEPGEDEGDAEAGADTINPDAEQSEVVARLRRERARLLRSYKIQEVIRRRQIMLVQVMKEERGTKGAALTTYLSLAGRYCVLMPNTPKGGGISRKIATASDRTRLKKIAAELEVPEGMGLIIRTAGQERTKVEIRRDYEYLLRLWNDIRERTLTSVAPCAIYEEADLIRRAMRDLYSNDIEEVLVEGEVGYKTAKAFMTMLMPSRARRVKQYKADTPVFFAYKVEDQLDKMHNATVQLRSGGSIVIHTTEALTAVDVNSGRATRERHIDETAVKTNLEAADEIARQMRLRDIAGLVVIDFIDMSEHRHQRQVEKRLRDALKIDRARLQVGRISAFGLLELSRQRLRPSFLELSTQPCTTCHGTGFIRSTESAALQALRRVEALGVEGKASKVAVTLPVAVALYVLNQKRHEVQRVEQRYALDVLVRIDDALVASEFRVEVMETARVPAPEEASDAPEVTAAPEPEAVEERDAAKAEAGDDGSKRKRRRRRRPRRKSEGEAPEAALEVEADEVLTADDDLAEAADAGNADEVSVPVAATPVEAAPEELGPVDEAPAAEAPQPAEADAAESPKPKRRRRRRKTDVEADAGGEAEPAPEPEEAPMAAAATELVLPPIPDIEPLAAPVVEEPAAVEAMEVAAAPEEETAPATAAANGHAAAASAADDGEAEPVQEEVALADRPGVTVTDAGVSEEPRRQGWWSRWTKSSGAG